MIKNRLDTYLASNDDVQRAAFQETKLSAQGVLYQLAKVLYLFEGIMPNIPRTLESSLMNTWKELTFGVPKVPREWQLPENRDQYLMRKRKDTQATDEKSQYSDKDSNYGGKSMMGSPRDASDDEGQGRTGDASRRRQKMSARVTGLADISEREELKSRTSDMSAILRQNLEGLSPLIPPLKPSSSFTTPFKPIPQKSGGTKKRHSVRPASAMSRGEMSCMHVVSYWGAVMI